MEYIRVTKENIDAEHICCAIVSNKDVQMISKKTWMKERLEEGLVFLKANIRGKCFIEYHPWHGQIMDCFTMGNILPMKFCQRKSFKHFAKN